MNSADNNIDHIINDLLTPPPNYTSEDRLVQENIQLSQAVSKLRRELQIQKERAKRYKKKYIRTKYREYSNRRLI